MFHDAATTEIYTLSLHDALPIYRRGAPPVRMAHSPRPPAGGAAVVPGAPRPDRRPGARLLPAQRAAAPLDRKSTRLNSSHPNFSYVVFCLKHIPTLLLYAPPT